MDSLYDLNKRIERVISELKDITQLLERDIADSRKVVSFGKVKEIEASMARLERQGLPVPTELKELKINLFSRHEHNQERIALYQKLQQGISGFLKQETARVLKRTRISEPDTGRSPYRRPSNYEKPLGSKGYSNLEDYLIPVIRLMWNGRNHNQAFLEIAKKLDVRYNTVSSQCTRSLGLTTDEFISQVNSKAIVDLLERKYPDQYQEIKAELKI
jgi:hypothetical protein